MATQLLQGQLKNRPSDPLPQFNQTRPVAVHKTSIRLDPGQSHHQSPPAEGHIEVLSNHRSYPESEITRIGNQSSNKLNRIFTVSFQKGPAISGSAAGTDLQHHLFNAYLVGYQPFDTDNVWIPLYTLAKRKQYQLDQYSYGGHEEIWQTSYEAHRLTRGDCEDHAIALADWLIEMGEDARVVIGKYKNEGHAWVILFKDGKEFLLEATNKSKLTSLHHYPLARLQTDYRPSYMFNRHYFWSNTGSSLTTVYSGHKWQKMSLYHRAEQTI